MNCCDVPERQVSRRRETDRFLVQAALKRAYAEFNRASEMDALAKLMSTERMRASCCVPRDPTALYKHMRKAGLEYGPKFRLLTEVFIQGPMIPIFVPFVYHDTGPSSFW